jgi:lipoate-protein ligase A
LAVRLFVFLSLELNTDNMSPLRWLIDRARDGASNMARDEALLQCVSRGDSPASLRFYRWSPPTISLGYFQPYEQFAALPPPARDLPVVRRQTGGGAILHDRELTYSLTLPLGHPRLGDGGPNALYDHVHGAFAALLTRNGLVLSPGTRDTRRYSHRGPFFCFERHAGSDLLADGKKLMGSAQRRTGYAVLQHGSLILGRRFDQQICAAVADFTRLDINDCLPELAAAIGAEPAGPQTPLTPAERQLAEKLRDKYDDPAWTRRR